MYSDWVPVTCISLCGGCFAHWWWVQEGNLLPRQHYTVRVHKQHSYLLPYSMKCYQHLAGYHEVLVYTLYVWGFLTLCVPELSITRLSFWSSPHDVCWMTLWEVVVCWWRMAASQLFLSGGREDMWEEVVSPLIHLLCTGGWERGREEDTCERTCRGHECMGQTYTIDREIFTLKIIRMKTFRVVIESFVWSTKFL